MSETVLEQSTIASFWSPASLNRQELSRASLKPAKDLFHQQAFVDQASVGLHTHASSSKTINDGYFFIQTDGSQWELQRVACESTTKSEAETLSDQLDTEYVAHARRSMDLAWQIINVADGWTKEAGEDDEKGVVYSKRVAGFGKVFKLVATVDVGAEQLYSDTIENAERSVEWNPTLVHLRVLQRSVPLCADVCYAVAEKGAGGLVSSRDFVYVRHWAKKDGWFATSSQSVDYRGRLLPPANRQGTFVDASAGSSASQVSVQGDQGLVRGVNGPGCMRFRQHASGKCRVEWLCNTNLKGWLPQWVTDKALSGAQLTFLAGLRKRCDQLKKCGAEPTF